MDQVQDTITEREDRYGEFRDNAEISIGIMDIMQGSPNWNKLPAFMKKSLITIADKISRILTGDPHYTDNWHDIQGYAKLVEDRCDTSEPNQSELPLGIGGTPPPISVRLVLSDGVTITNVSSDDLELCPLKDCVAYEGKTFKHSKTTGGYHEVVEGVK